MSDKSATVRGARTGIQGGAAAILLEAGEAFSMFDLDERQYAVALVLLTALLSFAQNLLEQRRGAHAK